MKANELSCKDLMVGDWVRIKITQHNTKVTNIDANSVNTEAAYPIRYDEIEPISLTPEILEKNGHKVTGYAVWDLEDAGAEVQWVRETMDTINPSMQYRLAPRQKNFGVQETLICHIKYVHELQHALRICGIEKDIEL